MNALLRTRAVEKPWGIVALPPPFTAPNGKRIGEIWFEPPPELPQLLVKYIFTSEALSVQVHPSDAQTEAAGLGRRGKEECWTIVHAEPGARLGIGFTRPVSTEQIRAAALDGSIERLMRWYPVAPGDFFYIPANTVHAIGAGIGLIEVQQNSDLTYRLYDYGRPRALHLDDGMRVASGEPYDERCRVELPATGAVELVRGPKFRLSRLSGAPDAQLAARYRGPLLVIPLDEPLRVDGVRIDPGGCGLAPQIASIEATEASAWLAAHPCL
ncbi:MAG: class I mannose-6-phosphate isomerase [Novosphingobium sp.]